MAEPEDNPYASPQTDHAPATASDGLLWFDLVLIAFVIAATVVGFAIGKGVGLAVVLVVTPVLVRSLLVFRRRARKQIPTTVARKAGMVVASAAVAVAIYAILVTVVVAWACVAVFIACLSICTGAASDLDSQLGSYSIGAVVALLGGLWLSSRLIVLRWRRDTQEP